MLSLAYSRRMTNPISDEALACLARQSTGSNRANAMTGVMFRVSDGFIQVLEGEPAAVVALFRRIKADTRHRDVRVVSGTPLVNRVFCDWSTRVIGESQLSAAERAVIGQAVRSPDPEPIASERPSPFCWAAPPPRSWRAPCARRPAPRAGCGPPNASSIPPSAKPLPPDRGTAPH